MTVERAVTATFLSMMAAGVRIGGEKTKPCVVTRTRAADVVSHGADAGTEPPDPPHVFGARLSRASG